MPKIYNERIYTVGGAIVTVDQVSNAQLTQLREALSDDKSVIKVTGDTKKIQLVPVRNIALIELEEVDA